MQIGGERFMAVIRKHLKYLKDGEPLDLDGDLRAMGLDSFAAVNLLFELEDALGLALPDDALSERTFATPRALRDAFHAATAQH